MSKKWLYAFIGFASVILLWQLVIIIGNYPEALLPGPAAVFTKWWALVVSGTLFEHLSLIHI